MVLIFEGPDNVGKTTQIKNLLKYLLDYPTFVIHFSGIPGITPEKSEKYSRKMYEDMFEMMHDAHQTDRNLIFDRSHLGEYVYSPIYRNYSGEFVFDIEKKNEDIIQMVPIKLFVMIDQPENLIKRDDGNSYSIELMTKQVEINSFIETYERTLIIDKHLINVSGLSIEQVHHIILAKVFPFLD